MPDTSLTGQLQNCFCFKIRADAKFCTPVLNFLQGTHCLMLPEHSNPTSSVGTFCSNS